MAKSALDKLKEKPQKDLVKMLGCPQDYGLTGVYTLAGKCQFGAKPPSENYCKQCWSKKL